MSAIQRIFIVLTFTLPPALAWGGRRWRHRRFDENARVALGILLLVLEGLDLFFKIFDGTFTLRNALPMQLCDWALVVTAAALLLKSQTAFDLAYFWGLAGTFQALFTPAIGADLSAWRLAGFFGIHAGIVISVFYLILAFSFRPWPRSILRVFLWSQAYLVLALLANRFAKANYGFLSRKPSTHTLLDILSDEQRIYVLQLEGLAILFFSLLYVPWWLVDRVRRK